MNFVIRGIERLQQNLYDFNIGTAIFSSYYDEAALSLPSLRIMRTMVQNWLRDVASYSNAFADIQIIHFYRWLQSPGSLLYDPAIMRTLQVRSIFPFFIKLLKLSDL